MFLPRRYPAFSRSVSSHLSFIPVALAFMERHKFTKCAIPYTKTPQWTVTAEAFRSEFGKASLRITPSLVPVPEDSRESVYLDALVSIFKSFPFKRVILTLLEPTQLVLLAVHARREGHFDRGYAWVDLSSNLRVATRLATSQATLAGLGG